ncbi:hypothetical protein FLONG3_10222 [Fusarium longipes]|uniref:Choloylglycine hydrolase/NAAA C-terminal domain-containing protein n=1 Tax=Fusarium longipes TaxID=694270 RepID=A0A395RRP6_9HYPO|nr:hypothetical protein FLONG3_10222 [Fusarium longipes]
MSSNLKLQALTFQKAVSVYIPTWKDTVAWAKRDPDLISQLKTGYPRFFVPLVVGQLAEKLLQCFSSESNPDELPTELRVLLAESGRSAMLLPAGHHASMCQEYLNAKNKGVTFVLRADFDNGVYFADTPPKKCTLDEVYAVVYPRELAVEAKAFWQHTGFGVSSRRATHWLENAPSLNQNNESSEIDLRSEQAANSKLFVQRRIADLLSTENNCLDTDDVFLYPSGMSSISHVAETIQHLKTDVKRIVAILGFLYVDTFKVLTNIYGFDYKLYGATPSDLVALEADLVGGLQLSALFTEFPGNPLLGSVDLERLQKLGVDHDFLFVVDDTVATSVNVDLISYCDVVCTSLTKMFSGSCNVMGGSIALNPQTRLFPIMKQLLKDGFIDTYFPRDAIVMEKNSANFEERVSTANNNAERTAEMLRTHTSVEQVYYPKGNPTQDIYEKYKRPKRGYGYLLSVRFKTSEAAIAFHDALDVAKGPSLGTNFTLCSQLDSIMRLLPCLAKLSLVFACTRVVYRKQLQAGPSYITGRTVDYTPDNDLTFWIFPAGINRHGGISDNPLKWKSRYGSTMATMFNRISVEGLNEKGLSGSSLFLGGSDYSQRDSRPGLSAGVWLQYYLDQYDNVKDIAKDHCPDTWRDKEKIQIVRESPIEGLETKIHITLSDTRGDNLIMEYADPEQRLRCYRSEYYDVVAGDTYHMKRQRSKKKIWSKVEGRMLEQWPFPYERYDRLFFYNYHIKSSDSFDSALAHTMGMIRALVVPQIHIKKFTDNRVRDMWPTQWMMYTAPAVGFVYFESAKTPLSFNYKLSNFDLFHGSDIKLLRVRDRQQDWQNGTRDFTHEFRNRETGDIVPFMVDDFGLP